jgi:LPXTG-motif cell wall-anchored protein
MNNATNFISKAAALLMVIIGLTAMLVAWYLLLMAGSHSITVFVLEIGGVLLCLAGYFLWRRKKPEMPSLRAGGN